LKKKNCSDEKSPIFLLPYYTSLLVGDRNNT
jgi:hypothetical protein